MHPVRVVSGPVARAIVFSSAFALDCLILLTVRFHTSAKAVVTQGHGIASGKTWIRVSKGTLAMQASFFGSGNEPFGVFSRHVEPIRSSLFVPTGTPLYSFPQVKWTPCLPPENFSFYPCGIRLIGEDDFTEALVYWPHPSTKPEFHQDPHVLEILAPRIPSVRYGKEMEIRGHSRPQFFLPEG